jgi:hypothetical protein
MLRQHHALVSAVLLEQDDYWQLEDRSMVSAACMAAIATLKDLPAPDLQPQLNPSKKYS